MGQWFESLSAHSHDRGERGQGDEGDPKTRDSRRAAGRRTKRPAQRAQPAGAQGRSATAAERLVMPREPNRLPPGAEHQAPTTRYTGAHVRDQEPAPDPASLVTLRRSPLGARVGCLEPQGRTTGERHAEATSTRWSKRKRSSPARPSDWTPDSGSSTRTRRVASRSPSTSWNRYGPRSMPSCST